ncbi:unnamed protein product [Moneuplotes crassus]|uniref:Uncharacterized protein n=1 Tax=Euplotes crassus TaxID=5936 RepID=A0AAD1Y6W3_EUPCR|nr:unnamed protein product [Moneuplotes crassus]
MEEGDSHENIPDFYPKQHLTAQSVEFLQSDPSFQMEEGQIVKSSRLEERRGKVMRYSNFTSGREIIESQDSCDWCFEGESSKNQHISALEKLYDSDEVTSLISCQISPRKKSCAGIEIRSPNKPTDNGSNFGMSMIYTTMKVNKTPLDEKGNRMELKFPPAEMIENLDQPEENLQTFDLMTYDKENPSLSSIPKTPERCQKCNEICNCKNTNEISDFNPIREIFQITANQVETDSEPVCDESSIMRPDQNDIYCREAERLNQEENQKNLSLIKKQNGIIKRLKKDVDAIKNLNKSIPLLREENIKFLKRIEILEAQIKMKNIQKVNQQIQTCHDAQQFTQRKEVIEFLIKNQSKAIQFTPHLAEIFLKLIVENDTPGHHELVSLLERFCKDNKNILGQQKFKLSDSIIELSSSGQEAYSTVGTFEKLQQLYTFGNQNQPNHRSQSRCKVSSLNEKVIESESSSKYSFCDKENQMDIRAIIPKFTKRDQKNQCKKRDSGVSVSSIKSHKINNNAKQNQGNSRNKFIVPASTLRYDINKTKIVLKKSKKVKTKAKKSRNNPVMSSAKTSLDEQLCDSKLGSVGSLLKEKCNKNYSISSSQDTQPFGGASKGTKLKVIKNFSKTTKLDKSSFVKTHDRVPTICVTQVKKSTNGGKSRTNNESKNYNFCAKRGSLNNYNTKSNKDSRRDMFCTASTILKDSTNSRNNKNILNKKACSTYSERFIRGVPKKGDSGAAKRLSNYS